MLNSLRKMDEARRKRLLNELMWLVAVVVLTVGSEGSHWWRHRATVAPATVGVNSQAR
jgi:hypothetical protein